VIYDDVLPSHASPFRTLEYRHYLEFFDRSLVVSLGSWHFDFAHAGFGDLRGALDWPDELQSKILDWESGADVVPRLAYVTFLANAQRLLPYFEARRIPFILQLYPGGSFERNVAASDESLRRVLTSPLCRRIIATQGITRAHLIDRLGCEPAKVELIYGGVFDSHVHFDFDRDKRFLGRAKQTLDICFVAHRYGSDMAQKGYDQFVEVARLLASDSRLRFHVVGDYHPEDVPLGSAAGLFTFYGPRRSEFFGDFYPGMDVILSPNQPRGIESGAFDGFPTGACMEAGFRGVLNCVTDPLSMNVAFVDDKDILIIDRDAHRTAYRLAELMANPTRLYELARANCRAFRREFDLDRQLWSRTRLIVRELLLADEPLLVRPYVAPTDIARVWTAQEQARAADLAAADATRRLDDLLADYGALAAGFEELQEYMAAQDHNWAAEYQRLRQDAGFREADLRRRVQDLEERRARPSGRDVQRARLSQAFDRFRFASRVGRHARGEVGEDDQR
jgi:glycosyltransferase involved in cell wall biosynthesis